MKRYQEHLQQQEQVEFQAKKLPSGSTNTKKI